MATLMRCVQPYWAGNEFVPVGTVYPAGHPGVIDAFYEPFDVEEPRSRDDIIAEAESYGIKVDRRKGDDTLLAEIEAAKATSAVAEEE